jgi:hypothetical protein
MDPNYSFPTSPGRPLSQFSAERVNRENASPAGNHSRDSSIHEKIGRFESLGSQGFAAQVKASERKTNDAALKRAMLGREAAENEKNQAKEDAKVLQKQLREGKAREHKMAERMEEYMVR